MRAVGVGEEGVCGRAERVSAGPHCHEGRDALSGLMSRWMIWLWCR